MGPGFCNDSKALLIKRLSNLIGLFCLITKKRHSLCIYILAHANAYFGPGINAIAGDHGDKNTN